MNYRKLQEFNSRIFNKQKPVVNDDDIEMEILAYFVAYATHSLCKVALESGSSISSFYLNIISAFSVV